MIVDDRHEDVNLALNYAPALHRSAFETLFALDHRLSQIVAAAKEPQLAAIRLAWWRDQLEGLETAAEPADPLLIACRALLGANPVTGTELANIAEGWAMMLSPNLDSDSELRAAASLRGASLFAAVSACVGAPCSADAGCAYALADIVRSSADAALRRRAAAMIVALPHQWFAPSLRPLALLAHWARIDARRMVKGKASLTMLARAASALGFAIFPKAV